MTTSKLLNEENKNSNQIPNEDVVNVEQAWKSFSNWDPAQKIVNT